MVPSGGRPPQAYTPLPASEALTWLETTAMRLKDRTGDQYHAKRYYPEQKRVYDQNGAPCKTPLARATLLPLLFILFSVT